MHSIELLEQALATAEQLGYCVRQEYLGGAGGGAAEFGGKKWIFVDLALSIPEQLDLVLEALRSDARLISTALSPALRKAVTLRRAA